MVGPKTVNLDTLNFVLKVIINEFNEYMSFCIHYGWTKNSKFGHPKFRLKSHQTIKSSLMSLMSI
jgi:hypothetical protein